jgi:hypothetical protein
MSKTIIPRLLLAATAVLSAGNGYAQSELKSAHGSFPDGIRRGALDR